MAPKHERTHEMILWLIGVATGFILALMAITAANNGGNSDGEV